MKSAFIFGVATIFIISACNLAPDATEAVIPPATIVIENDTATAPPPTATPLPTSTPVPANVNEPVAVVPNCTPRSDWPTYTVQRGDTLFSIAQRANSNVDTLATANCLADAATISTGQTLYVPNAIRANENIAYWVQTQSASADTLRVACESLITPMETALPRTNDTATNIRNSLNSLFNAQNKSINNWAQQGLSVQSVAIDSNGRATIVVSGDMLLIGTCGDGIMLAQVLLSVFAEPQVQSAFITVGGRNMAQIFDMSGLKPADAIFTRDNIPLL